LLLLVHFK